MVRMGLVIEENNEPNKAIKLIALLSLLLSVFSCDLKEFIAIMGIPGSFPALFSRGIPGILGP